MFCVDRANWIVFRPISGSSPSIPCLWDNPAHACVAASNVRRNAPVDRQPALPPPIACIMAANDLAVLLTDSGVPETSKQYIMEGRGFKTVALFARSALSAEKLLSDIVEPVIAGFKKGETQWKEEEDAGIVRASITVAWEEAVLIRAKALQVQQPPPDAQLDVQAQGAGAPQPGTCPTKLQPGDWQKQVDAFESKYMPPRTFPVKVLLGAEAVLARLLGQKRVTQEYTPLELGEIMQQRAYSADGNVNPHRQRRRDNTMVGLQVPTIGGVATWQVRNDDWAPAGQWALQDALDSVKWAYVWAEYCSDEQADAFVALFLQQLRLGPGRVEITKAFYQAASWRVCMAMRTGLTSPQACDSLIKDIPWQTQTLQNLTATNTNTAGTQGPNRDRRRGKGEQRGNGDRDRRQRSRSTRGRTPPLNRKGGGKGAADANGGGNKGGGKGAGRQTEWRRRHNNRDICRNYQTGQCEGRRCQWGHEHVCALCLRPGHGAATCGTGR